MTPEEVRTVVNSLLSDKIVMSWWQLAIVILLTGVAAYFGAYLKNLRVPSS
jgi:Ca2+-dependent lipid-binding protein